MPYWYRFYVGECPVCGRDKSYKERVTNEPRPEQIEDRYVTLSHMKTYDWCDAR